MRICPKCGNQLSDNAKFCNMCGEKCNGLDSSLNSQNKKKSKAVPIIGIIVAIIIALVIVILISASIKNNNNSNDIADTTLYTTSAEVDLNYDTGYTLSDDLFDFQVQVGNIVYQFPMSVEDFMKTGLTLGDEDANQKISSGYGTSVYFTYADGSEVLVQLVNFSKNETLAKDCHVVGITLNSQESEYSPIKFDTSQIKLAKNIVLGVSTLDDVKAAYGKPNETSERDDYGEKKTHWTYTKSLYHSVEFDFNSENILLQIRMENVEKPKNIKETGPSNEVPDMVKNYVKPTKLGTDLTSGIFKLEGDLYRLPCPLSELMGNGWKVVEKSASTIAGRNSAYVSIAKGNVQIDNVYLRNYEEYEVPIKYGIIEKIDSTGFTYGKEGNIIIPNGINMDTKASAVDSTFEKANAERKDDIGTEYTYTIENGQYKVAISIENGAVSYYVIYWTKK